jgi:hypothetical protein
MPNWTQREVANYEARNIPAHRRGGSLGASEASRPVEREMTLHNAIIAECKRKGWRYIHSDTTKPTTCGEGVCDFIIYADGGRMFHVECKSAKGKLSMEQRIFIVWIEKLGHAAHVIDNFMDFLRIANGGQANA